MTRVYVGYPPGLGNTWLPNRKGVGMNSEELQKTASLVEAIKEYGGMGNGERDNAVADWIITTETSATAALAKHTKPDLCVCGTKTRAEQGCECEPPRETTRTFATGATRDTEEGKLDYEGAISPLVLERYVEYMEKHRVQGDGTLRSADNWQKGIPDSAYMKSLWRHFMDVWKAHRSGGDMEEALCAMLFNTMGLLFEIVRVKDYR